MIAGSVGTSRGRKKEHAVDRSECECLSGLSNPRRPLNKKKKNMCQCAQCPEGLVVSVSSLLLFVLFWPVFGD